jgi:porin
LTCAPAAAQTILDGVPEPSIATSLPPSLADPANMRSSLASAGITYGFNYTSDVLGNVSGGIERRTHFAGLLEVYADIEFEKLAGWRGLTLHASGYQIHGTSISGETLGSIAAVSNVEAYPSTRLFELWLEQKLLQDMLSIRIGQVAADAEFFGAEQGGNFINSTFGWTAISSDNIPIGGPIYPIATPGVRVSFDPNDNLKIMAGLWNGDPVGPCPVDLDPGQCNTHGLDFRLGDPPLLIVESAYAHGAGHSHLPGTLKVGGWRHFGHFHDLRRDTNGGLLGITNGEPVSHAGNHGLYAVFEQMVYRLPGEGEAKGISIFGRAAGSPSDRNQIDVYFDAGVVFSGFVSGRPGDVFGVAFAYAGVSEEASAFDRDTGAPVVREHESVLEVSYTAEVLPGWSLQPDFQ